MTDASGQERNNLAWVRVLSPFRDVGFSMVPTVLIADDDPVLKSVFRMMFKNASVDLQFFVDGLGAWQYLQHHLADVIVLDVQMPRMSGIEVCEQIRRTPALERVPVIFLTGRAFELSDAFLKTANVHAVIGKPFSPRAVRQMVLGLVADANMCLAIPR